MFDILSNHRAEKIRALASQIIGATASTAIDLFSNGMAGRALLIIDVTSVGTGGTLVLTAQDDGKLLAHIGSKTQCGATIITGDASFTIE